MRVWGATTVKAKRAREKIKSMNTAVGVGKAQAKMCGGVSRTMEGQKWGKYVRNWMHCHRKLIRRKEIDGEENMKERAWQNEEWREGRWRQDRKIEDRLFLGDAVCICVWCWGCDNSDAATDDNELALNCKSLPVPLTKIIFLLGLQSVLTYLLKHGYVYIHYNIVIV